MSTPSGEHVSALVDMNAELLRQSRRFRVPASLGLLWILAGASPTPAQESLPQFAEPAQVEALNQYVAKVGPPATTPVDLVRLSRLLADPTDQIQWLIVRIERYRDAPDHQNMKDMAKRTQDRITQWQNIAGLNRGPFEKRIKRILESARRLVEVIDPDQLKARIAKEGANAIRNLDDADKFTLFSRGVAQATSTKADWDPLRVIMNELAGPGGAPPKMWKLIKMEQDLRAATGRLPAGTLRHGASRITAALLGRAMGLDGEDRRLPEDDDANSWDRLALDLEQQNLWRWAALARLLQAASMSATRAEDARQQWKKVLTVDPNAWRGVDAWLGRIKGGQFAVEGAMPLDGRFRETAREKRKEHEGKVRDASGIDEAFRQMQLAKAAEAGFDTSTNVVTATLDDLESWFGIRDNAGKLIPDSLHLFLELLEVDGRYYGVALGAKDGLVRSGGQYIRKRFGPLTTAADVVADALNSVGLSASFKGKIIIAPDHAVRVPSQLEQIEAKLIPHVGASESWYVYVPTAAALADESQWTLEPTLRYWYQSALRYDQPTMGLLGGRREIRKIKVGNNVPRAQWMYAVNLAGKYPRLPSSNKKVLPFLRELADEKRERTKNNAAKGIVPFVLHAEN